jgi:hypothetical protein
MKRFALAVGAIVMLAPGIAFLEANGVLEPVGAQSGAKPAKAAAPAGDLDQILAPIALYPDQLLAQMLLCAQNPAKIGALDEWLKSHPSLKGTDLQDAAAQSGFDDSFVALSLFPDVVAMMAEQIDWTTRLGKAFAADRKAVFASIQRLRDQARDAGTLKTTQQQQVETRTSASGQEVIVIEPANPQVVYVPQYNPQVVYTQPSSTTVVVEKESSSADAAVAGIIGFTAGIAIGAAIDNDYYYGPYGWHGGVYMYDDAWDDWYDAREDAREDWQDHREDMAEERGDRARNSQEERTERTQSRQENRPESQAQREQRRTDAQSAAPAASASSKSRTSSASQASRGYSGGDARTSAQRSGTSSDAFSGYSSGRSERAASSRGQRSRSSSRSSGRRR